MVKRGMPTYQVETPQRCYAAIVERGVIGQAAHYIPPKSGKVFVVTTEDVWFHAGAPLAAGLAGGSYDVLHLPGGEEQKRLAHVEQLAEEMLQLGADRSSMVIAYGGGIVNDMGGFLAAIFMRGIPVLQIPTTLLAQVDAAIGGKTAVNLVGGKNLIGSFHQPVAVPPAPAILDTLPEREYRSGLYEIIKAGIIREPELFTYLKESSADVVARKPAAVDHIIAESVRMKAEGVPSGNHQGGHYPRTRTLHLPEGIERRCRGPQPRRGGPHHRRECAHEGGGGSERKSSGRALSANPNSSPT